MSPGSKYDDGVTPPIDDDNEDDGHHFEGDFRRSPEDEDSDIDDDSEQIIKDGNDFILKELEAQNISRQYSKAQAKKTIKTSGPALTLDGVDWSGFSAAAHVKDRKLRSNRRPHAFTNSKEEIVEITVSKSSQGHGLEKPESTLRLAHRKLSVNGALPSASPSSNRLSPGKYKSRRAASTNPETTPLNDPGLRTMESQERLAKASFKDQSRGNCRPRRSDRLGGGETNRTGSSGRSRRNTRVRADSGEIISVANSMAQQDVPGDSGHRPRRSHLMRSNSGELDSPSPISRITRSERRLSTMRPQRDPSSRSPGSRVPRSERGLNTSSRKPRKHRSTGTISRTRQPSTSNRNMGRSISPGNPIRGKSPSSRKGLAAASATTLELSTKKTTRSRRDSNSGFCLSGRDLRESDMIGRKSSLQW